MFENVTITQEQFDDIIKKHLMWRSNPDTGQRATLINCYLKNIHYKGGSQHSYKMLLKIQ